MANTYKNIIVTPNIGNSADPRIQFSGGNTTANTDINLYVYPLSNGTLSFEGSAGQLFSITNDLSNSLFSVNDISGITSLEIFANGLISVAPLGGNVVFGNTSELILSPGTGVYANGSLGTDGQILSSNGTSVYWTTSSATVNSVASGNGLTGGPITTSGTLSVLANSGIVANSSGLFVNATYIGTISANNTTFVNGKTEGDLNVNSATTSTTSSNSTHLGGVAAASYVQNTDSRTLSGNLVFSGANVTFTGNATISSTSELIISPGAGIYANGTLGNSAQILTSNGSSVFWANSFSTIEFIIDGGGSAITTGIKGDVRMPYNCTIEDIALLADQSGSIVIDLWKDTYTNYPPTVADTITASAKPTLSSASKYQDTTLTGWSKTISSGDIIRVNVDSVSTIQRLTLSMKVIKT